MVKYLLVIAVIIFICVFLNRVSSKMGVPVLLLFIFLGMALGVNEDFSPEGKKVVEEMCTIALIFIIFYGGFGTKWKAAKPVALESGLLATAGVLVTAGVVGSFCRFVMGWNWVESLLLGSVISSTDAATVFSVLRTNKIGLKNRTAPILELESGSNDPCSYMLTVVMLSVLKGSASGGMVAWLIVSQLLFGILGGLLISQGALYILKRYHFSSDGFGSMFMLAVAIIAYALPSACGGNGYLSAYIVGIVLGNNEFHGRKPMVGFFDGVTSLMQIVIFFFLGLMVNHVELGRVILPALLVFAFLTLIARPLAVASILAPFRKFPLKQIVLISFVGLRGAASIAFAIMIITGGSTTQHDIFSVVFMIVLVSISLQGTLIPWVSRKLNMIDTGENAMSTFSDFSDSSSVSFGRFKIADGDKWCGEKLMDLKMPSEMLIVLVIRGKKRIVPTGSLVFEAGDKVILCSKTYDNGTDADLHEYHVSKISHNCGKPLKDCKFRNGAIVVLVRRGEEEIIPDGNTVLSAGDILILLDPQSVAQNG